MEELNCCDCDCAVHTWKNLIAEDQVLIQNQKCECSFTDLLFR